MGEVIRSLFTYCKEALSIFMVGKLFKTHDVAERRQKTRDQYIHGGLSYDEDVVIAGYIMVDLTVHGNLICRLFEKYSTLSESIIRADINEQVRVACIGCGPGTEMLGILKYCLTKDVENVNLHFSLFDDQNLWGRPIEIFQEVIEKYPNLFLNRQITCTFNILDITGDIPLEYQLTNHHLFTISFLFSALIKQGSTQVNIQKAIDNIVTLFRRSAENSILMLIDVNSDEALEQLDKIANGVKDYSVIIGDDRQRFYPLDINEQKTDLDVYFTDTYSPKLSIDAAYKIFQRNSIVFNAVAK